MPTVKVVVVGVEGEVNLGFIVRLCRNFNVDELALVKPYIDPRSDTVKRYAANGWVFMDSSRVKLYNSLEEALQGVGLSACTSAVIDVDSSDMLRKAIDLEEFVEIARNYSSIAVVFGRESVGLTRDEISKCNLLVHISANPEYPVLNLSHAVGIVLYRLYKSLGRPDMLSYIDRAEEEKIRLAERYVDQLANIVAADERQRQMYSTFFKRFIRRAVWSKQEVGVLITFIRRIARRLMLEVPEADKSSAEGGGSAFETRQMLHPSG